MKRSDRSIAIEWARALLAVGNFVVLDTETTGLNRNRDDEPCAIAIIAPDGKMLIDYLIKPTISIDEGAESVHGISNEMVQNAPAWADVRAQIWDVLRDKTVVIYNAAYDMSILENADCDAGKDDVQIDEIAAGWECAMEQYAQFWGDWNDYRQSYKWQRLTAACAQQEIEVQTRPHSALGDCLRTLAVIQAMAKADPNASD